MVSKCRLCGGTDLSLYFTQGNDDQFEFFRCADCTLVNFDFEAHGHNQEKYADVYVDPFDEAHKRNVEQTDSYQFIKKNLTQKGAMLDLGCGNGRLLYKAQQDGWQVQGLELSEFLATSIKDKLGINVYVANFLAEEQPLKKQFDLVTLRHVLEHLPDPILAMKRIFDLVKPNGHAILEFPNIEGFDLKMKRKLHQFGLYHKKYSDEYVPGHCNEYCKQSFSLLADKTGFALNKWMTYSSKPILTPVYGFFGNGNKVRVLLHKPENQHAVTAS